MSAFEGDSTKRGREENQSPSAKKNKKIGEEQSLTSAQQLNSKISAQDSTYIMGLMNDNLQLISDEDKNAVFEIFGQLDTSGDGSLSVNDFKAPLPKHQADMTRIWETVSHHFDFDGNGEVDKQEFMGYFIIKALYLTPSTPIEGGNNLCASLIQFQASFTKNFRNAVNEFKTYL